MNLNEFLSKGNLKAAFYGRHSTKEQNIETQKSVCKKYADNNDICITHEYIDEGQSAFKKALDQREQLKQLRNDAKNGDFDCVLVYKADRLARKIDQHMQIWGEFRGLGIPVIIAESQKLYTTDNPHEIIIEIGLSSFESENTRVRTRDYYNSRTEEGRWLGGNVPYGYCYEEDEKGNKVIAQVSSEIERVKEIFKLYKQGYGFTRVSNLLNKESRDEKWIPAKIKAIITNPFYAGITTSQRIVAGSGNSVQPRGNWRMGECDKIPAAIELQTWEECMELYETKRRDKVNHADLITPYLFKGLLVCKECGEKLKTKNYQSGKRKKNGEKIGGRMYICSSCKQKWKAEKIEENLIEYILSGWHFLYKTFDNEELHEKITTNLEDKINELNKSISNLDKDVSKLIAKLKTGERKQKELMIGHQECDEQKEALVQYRISIQKRISKLESEIEGKKRNKETLEIAYGDFKNFDEFVKAYTDFEYDFDDPRFRKLMLYLLDEVVIDPDYQYQVVAKVNLEERGTLQMGSIEGHL